METLLVESAGLSRETIRNYMPYAASGAGASADAISAYAEYAPDLLFPWREDEGSQMFPGGNTGIARLLVRALVPAALPGNASLASLCLASIDCAALDRARQPVRVRLGATAVSVQHDGSPETASTVSVVYIKDGALCRVRAKAVVMAGGWTTLRVVRDLPHGHQEAYQQFHRMPCLVANIALRHWRFIHQLGITECQWFEGLGDSFAVRKVATFGAAEPSISPDQPTVLTLKILYTEPGLALAEQATRGRMRMLATSYQEYERTLREQLTQMFAAAGFDPRRDIAGIILNRWGHAYLCAQPGFFFGLGGKPAPRDVLRNAPFGRIAFANSDLSGIMDHRASIAEAARAVKQLRA
jgi:spermidine dehydrogenase